MRLILRKSQLSLFGGSGSSAPASNKQGRTTVRAHWAKNPGGRGRHMVGEHVRKVEPKEEEPKKPEPEDAEEEPEDRSKEARSMAASNFYSAIDMVHHYDDQSDAFDSYGQNVWDTAGEHGYPPDVRDLAIREYNRMVQEHIEKEAKQPEPEPEEPAPSAPDWAERYHKEPILHEYDGYKILRDGNQPWIAMRIEETNGTWRVGYTHPRSGYVEWLAIGLGSEDEAHNYAMHHITDDRGWDVYKVATYRVARAREKMEAIKKRARKLGVPEPSMEAVGEPFTERVDYEDPYSGEMHRTTVSMTWLRTTTAQVQAPGGWELRGIVDRLEGGGTTINSIGPQEVPHEIHKDVDGRCDHCNTTRNRAQIFLLQDPKGHWKHVGKSCLKDFSGIDPRNAASAASINKMLADTFGSDDGMGGGGRQRGAIDPMSVMVAAAYVAREDGGWVSKAKAETSLGLVRPSTDFLREVLSDKKTMRELYKDRALVDRAREALGYLHGLTNEGEAFKPPSAPREHRLKVSSRLLDEWAALEVDTHDPATSTHQRTAFVRALENANKKGRKYELTLDADAQEYLHDRLGPIHNTLDVYDDARGHDGDGFGSMSKQARRALVKELESIERADITPAWHPTESTGTIDGEYLRNANTLALAPEVPPKKVGLLGSAILAPQRARERAARQAAREAANAKRAAGSAYFGSPGQKIGKGKGKDHPPFEVTVDRVAGPFENDWGTTHLVVMRDDDGRTFNWWSTNGGRFHSDAQISATGKTKSEHSNNVYNDIDLVGQRFEIRGATIKKHDERQGVKQTVLNRVQLHHVMTPKQKEQWDKAIESRVPTRAEYEKAEAKVAEKRSRPGGEWHVREPMTFGEYKKHRRKAAASGLLKRVLGNGLSKARMVMRKAKDGPKTGHDVDFRHPVTGAQRKGMVHASGHKGATVIDHETGEAHRVDHGHYQAKHPADDRPHAQGDDQEGAEGGQEGGAGRWSRDELVAYANERFARLKATSAALQAFREHIDHHLDLGTTNARASFAAAAVLVDQGIAPPAVAMATPEQLEVEGDEVRATHNMDGQQVTHVAHNAPRAAHIVASKLGEKGERVFGDMTEEKLTQYMTAAGAPPFEELQRWHATRLWAEAATHLGEPSDESIVAAAEHAGEAVGYDAQHMLDRCVDPKVVAAYRKGVTLHDIDGLAEAEGLTASEKQFLALLELIEQNDPYDGDDNADD